MRATARCGIAVRSDGLSGPARRGAARPGGLVGWLGGPTLPRRVPPPLLSMPSPHPHLFTRLAMLLSTIFTTSTSMAKLSIQFKGCTYCLPLIISPSGARAD